MIRKEQPKTMVHLSVVQHQNSSDFSLNWLHVSDTAEGSHVAQRVGHHLHAIMPLLEAFKS